MLMLKNLKAGAIKYLLRIAESAHLKLDTVEIVAIASIKTSIVETEGALWDNPSTITSNVQTLKSPECATKP